MEWIVSFFILLGSIFMLLAAFGLLKFPDLFTRMHATTKASSLAIVCFLIAAILYFNEIGITLRGVGIIIFIFLTTPVGAHLLARIGHTIPGTIWDKNFIDDYQKTQTKVMSRPSKRAPVSKKSGNQKISEIFRKLKDKRL